MTNQRWGQGARRLLPAAAVVIAVATAACSPTPGPSRSTAPSPSASTSTPAVDYTAPGQAEQVLDQLWRAALLRSLPAYPALIKVDLSARNAQIVVEARNQAHTYAIREGLPREVDGDTQYIGQTSFSLDDFDLRDVGAIFAQAAAISGSRENQQLQIVEYFNSRVYLTVTTSPESQTVFFRADATPIAELNLTTTPGLAQALADVTLGQHDVQQLGLDTTRQVWCDVAGGSQTIRMVRMSKFPPRQEMRNGSRSWPSFSPSVVDAATIRRVMLALDPTGTVPMTIEIDRRYGLVEPTMIFTWQGRSVVTNLAGDDVTSLLQR